MHQPSSALLDVKSCKHLAENLNRVNAYKCHPMLRRWLYRLVCMQGNTALHRLLSLGSWYTIGNVRSIVKMLLAHGTDAVRKNLKVKRRT